MRRCFRLRSIPALLVGLCLAALPLMPSARGIDDRNVTPATRQPALEETPAPEAAATDPAAAQQAQAAAAAINEAVTTSPALVQSAAAERQAGTELIEAAVAAVKPSLVRIQVVEANYYEGRAHKSESSGSGAIISPDGYIVTNHHVAGNAVRLFVTMSDREEIPATLVGTDPMADIAVIKLQPAKPRTFAVARWGDSTALEVGDPVLAMGSPLSLSQSVTEGIVANTAMTMPSWAGNFELDGEDVGSIVRWIAHDAVIFPGNSGGPLVNLSGEIIGINEISFGLGGAIPSVLARQVAERLIRDGEIKRAFLGFLLQPLFKRDSNEARGVLLSDVIKNSPAAKAGLQAGDRLLAIRGADEPASLAAALDPIIVRYAEELPPLNLAVASLPLGKPVEVVVEREGKQLSKTLEPVLREPVLRQRREFKPWGLTARDLSIWTAIELKRASSDGVLVTSVRPGGPAGQAKPDLQGGDVIEKINEKPVRDMDEFNTVTLELTKGATEPVPALVTFARRGEKMMTVVKVGIDELDDPGREVRKAWVPVGTQVLTNDLAKQLGQEGQTGVIITQLYETSASLGLQVGDVILTVDGEPIPSSEPHENEVFSQMIRQYKIGTVVGLSGLRAGEAFGTSVTLPAQPPLPREMKRYQDFDFEFTARNIAYLDKVGKQLEELRGVLIEEVEDGGWAALARVGAGDVLLEVDGQPINDVEQLKKLLSTIKEEKRPHVIFKLRRGVHTSYAEIEPMWDSAALAIK